jgi:hypothetical protein
VRRSSAIALLVAALVGCGQAPAIDAHGVTTSAVTPEAGEVCSDHYPDVRHAQPATVGEVRTLGPAVLDPPPGPLDKYPDDESIALCLVPSGDMFNVVAVVLSDDATYVRWVQNLDDDFSWPI